MNEDTDIQTLILALSFEIDAKFNKLNKPSQWALKEELKKCIKSFELEENYKEIKY